MNDDLVIRRSRTIAAPVAEVWALMAAPANLERAHPFCRRNLVQVWPGEEARDSIEYYNGLVLNRRFRRWLDGVGYDLEIGRGSGKDAEVRWRVEPAATGALLAIEIRPDLARIRPQWPAWLRRFVLRRIIAAQLGEYLDAVLQGFDHCITTGQPVRRNQFGPHPLFSPA